MIRVQMAGKTDLGLHRQINEDSFGIVGGKNLAIVCDGMGGHAAGEVASQCAVETLARLHHDFRIPAEASDAFEISPDFSEESRFLVTSVRIANTRIHRLSSQDSSVAGMGTTIVVARVHGSRISICHVGDSRAYRIREGVLNQLTQDHSLVGELVATNQLTPEEAEAHPNRNVITRALGVRERVKVDLREENVIPGDVFLLCTDGLTGCVPDTEILRVVTDTGDDLEAIGDGLIAAANAGGGDDNITCALIAIKGDDPGNLEDRKLETISFPEETDGEYQAQLVVGDILDEQAGDQGDSNQVDSDDDTQKVDTTESKGHSGSFVLTSLVVIVIIILFAYALDIGGAREVISGMLGLQ